MPVQSGFPLGRGKGSLGRESSIVDSFEYNLVYCCLKGMLKGFWMSSLGKLRTLLGKFLILFVIFLIHDVLFPRVLMYRPKIWPPRPAFVTPRGLQHFLYSFLVCIQPINSTKPTQHYVFVLVFVD